MTLVVAVTAAIAVVPTPTPSSAVQASSTRPVSAAGWVLDAWGGLHSFSVDAVPPPTPRGAPYWPGWDIARGVAADVAAGWGVEVDGWGGLHGFGFGSGHAPVLRSGAYWRGWDVVRGVALLADGSGGLVLDARGGLHGFATGSHSAPVARGGPSWPGGDVARGVTILADGTGGYVVDALGGLHPFGINGHAPPRPAVHAATWPTWDIVRGVAVLADGSGGYTLDAWGGMHGFDIGTGSAVPVPPGNGPYWLGWDMARGITIAVASPTLRPTGDWTSRLGDPSHASFTLDRGLTPSNVGTLSERWRLHPPPCNGVTNGAPWFATPVTFKGIVFIGDDFGCLHAIRESTGQILWTRFAAYQANLTCAQQLGIVSSVSVQDDGSGRAVLYFHSPDGYLYKLRGSDGATIWRSLVQIPSATANDVYAWSSPTVADGKVVIGVSSNCDTPFTQGQVRAYDATTGRLLWIHKTVPDGFQGAGDWYDAAVDANGDVYVSTGSTYDATAAAHPNTTAGFEQYSLLKLDGTTGRLVWKAPAPQYLGDPDYSSSPILFSANGVGLVGATNKDGWFRAYRQDNGHEAWQAMVGTHVFQPDAQLSGGGLWDGSRLFVVSNTTNVGGTWSQGPFPGIWSPHGGVTVPGSVRRLDPASGAIVAVGGRPWEVPTTADVMGPCAMNVNNLMVCAGGQLVNVDVNAHNNGLFVIDTGRAASSAIVHHLEDRPNGVNTANFGEFAQPVVENGSILAANENSLVKWGH